MNCHLILITAARLLQQQLRPTTISILCVPFLQVWKRLIIAHTQYRTTFIFLYFIFLYFRLVFFIIGLLLLLFYDFFNLKTYSLLLWWLENENKKRVMFAIIHTLFSNVVFLTLFNYIIFHRIETLLIKFNNSFIYIKIIISYSE